MPRVWHHHSLSSDGRRRDARRIAGWRPFWGRLVPNGAKQMLPRGDRLLAMIVVEAAAGLSAEPAGLDIFHQQRTGPVFRIRESLVQHLHDREAGVEADE